MLEHDFLEDLGKCIAARVGTVALRLSNGERVGVEEVAHASVSTNQNELLKGIARATPFEEPEEPLYSHINDVIRSLLAGSEMNHMGDALQRVFHIIADCDVSLDDFKTFLLGEGPVVTKGPDGGVVEFIAAENAVYKCPADLAGCPGY